MMHSAKCVITSLVLSSFLLRPLDVRDRIFIGEGRTNRKCRVMLRALHTIPAASYEIDQGCENLLSCPILPMQNALPSMNRLVVFC